MTAPDASVTVPRMSAVVNCAKAAVVKRSRSAMRLPGFPHPYEIVGLHWLMRAKLSFIDLSFIRVISRMLRLLR
jgi:hypothetical protein